jgi:hypothetical protein
MGTKNATEQAFLNEFKGNLFEYLVGLGLSQKIKFENIYLQSIPTQLFHKLKQYEEEVRSFDKELMSKLNTMAKKACEYLVEEIKFDEVYLVGKIAASDSDNDFAEADLILKNNQKLIPVSLKLAKKNSFINTKSGGVKSFIVKYFGEFVDSQVDQINFNLYISRKYAEFSRDLHQLYSINYDDSFKNWREANLAELPGDLISEAKILLHQLYSDISNQLYFYLFKYSEHDRELFINALFRLIGNGSQDMQNLICYHVTNEEGTFHHLDQIKLYNRSILTTSNHYDFINNREISSFDIQFKQMLTLQVRIKPMNKFTSEAFKVNCSVKYFN